MVPGAYFSASMELDLDGDLGPLGGKSAKFTFAFCPRLVKKQVTDGLICVSSISIIRLFWWKIVVNDN